MATGRVFQYTHKIKARKTELTDKPSLVVGTGVVANYMAVE